ncbi:uncharacterized protein BDCG_07386 [Blastomyces dermatitidis ER-3]|uniref:Phosphotransferase enzyme family protein n=2 Tax=Ajellomyces dermatitidis TaxID=5039 RepID=F2TGY3_AJEDA|nr:uncharacterized protein BDCG_07386 [Blastomyces dermatitidis ER-3]EEQ92266.2 hypothetical protein BDCG_07386 [Blastomyces dermatitidis ER-3]EGE82496.2 phosphotransferase enzyme family protein [Blastomyces dermatitidis ATCC 18188]EQL36325.1 hypothetical protein BDFG_02065 [Blastomyces dermatitidis ATCC 26199]
MKEYLNSECETLSVKHNGYKVVKVGDEFVVKFVRAGQVGLVEKANMLFSYNKQQKKLRFRGSTLFTMTTTRRRITFLWGSLRGNTRFSVDHA